MLPATGQAVVTNWVAFNDHVPGAGTAANVSGYDLWVGPGGYLTNFTTADEFAAGQELLVKLEVTAEGSVALAGTMLEPYAGTPAYDMFVGIIDMATPCYLFTLGQAGQTTMKFTGLDPAMKYQFRTTSVRGRETDTPDRWTMSGIVGAASFTEAFTSLDGTDAISKKTFADATLADNEIAWNSGRNAEAGDILGWDNIVPGADGTFSVISKQYTGPTPGGTASTGAYAYGPECFMLVETGPRSAVTIAAQPAPVTTVDELMPFTLSLRAAGSSPTMQWYKQGVGAIAGATHPAYTVASAGPADRGDYYAVVRNSFSSVTSQVAHVTVNLDTTPPVLMYATGNWKFNGVRVWFSEGLDPTTAQNRLNYQLSGGVNVSSATLVAPAGSPGDNMVDLVTGAQTPGQTYTLTVSGVKDQSAAGNTVAAGSAVQFQAWTLTQGCLFFEHWDNLTGAADTDIDTALADERVVNDTPTTMGYLFGRFDTRTVFPDDSHEYYLARMTGWITPTETADYYFFLRSDDAGRLYLSANATPPDPAVDTPICVETDCCDAFVEPGTFNDDGTTSPTSEAIHLVAGQRYAVLALLKEHGGGDYLMVAWRKSTDSTPAANLPYLPGQYLSCYADPNADLVITKQPTDQVGVIASAGIEVLSETFDTSDGGFTVVDTDPPPPGPWLYDGLAGQWVADGSVDGCGGPYNSQLSSPPYKLTQDGAVSLSFVHKYSFETDFYDGGQVRISVNGGDFTAVPPENFTANGYADKPLIGNGILLGQRAFALDSPGYGAGEFVTSKALLGNFAKDDTLVVQFLGAWDECSSGKHPNWVIDSYKLILSPMIIQDFSKSDGGFTVQNTTPAPPGPFTYSAANGQWAANGGEAACSGPYNSKLTSPAYVVPQTDEVTLSFTHRYSFEGDYWDGGQVRISVNGGDFTPVPADNFTANGYAPGVIQGTGVLNGQRAFNGDSPGYATGAFITSSAVLGSFNKNDTIVVQFVGAWDECSSGSQPGWAIKSLQLAFGRAAKAANFEAEVTASRQGTPVAIAYQWERNDGAGWVPIFGATNPSYRIFPVASDFDATFRLVASVPGKSVISDVVKIVTAVVEKPTISISKVGGKITIVFTGKLKSAPQVTGPYEEVAGATSPYEVTTPAGQSYFRAVK